MTAAQFQAATNVSRETLAHLERYVALLRKWLPAINLVGARTLDDVWRRHMLDSAQLAGLASGKRWLDLGSGAGFPGLVLAILGVGEVHLVESDARKAAFLSAVVRETGVRATVHATRIESLRAEPFDVITARALAPLKRLLEWSERFRRDLAPSPLEGEGRGGGCTIPSTVSLFPKGQDVDVELTEAAKCWKLTVDRVPSLSDPRGTVLVIRGAIREQ